MDGTLIDSEPLHEESLVVALRSLGIEPPPNLHDRVLGVGAWDVYLMMRDELGVPLSFEEWIPRKYDHYLNEAPRLKARPGAVEIYRALKARGVAQAIVSNSDSLVVEANIRAIGIAEPGLKVVARNDVREGKPHAEPYLRAAYLTGVDPAETAVMEDSFPGATAGIKAGMRTVFWPQDIRSGPLGAIHAASEAEVRAALGL